MHKSRNGPKRFIVVTLVSVLAGYAGVRTVADTTKYQFQGFTQNAAWNFDGGSASMQCYQNKVLANGTGGGPSANVNYQSQVADWNAGTVTWTTLNANGAIPATAMSFNSTLSKPTTCSFTALPGSLTIWDNITGTNTYPVAVTADSRLAPTDIQSTRTISTVVTQNGKTFTKQQTIQTGKTGSPAPGYGGIAVTDSNGNVTILIPEGTPVTDWQSSNNYVTSGQITNF